MRINNKIQYVFRALLGILFLLSATAKLIGIDEEESEGDTGYFGLRAVGFGQMIWEPILEAGLEAGSKWVIVEQDEHYEIDPLECARRSREYLKILGW